MIIYHGSTVIVEDPLVDVNEFNADFGKGFYMTTSLEQAKRWAKIKMRRKNISVGYVSVYEFDFESLEKNCKFKKYDSATAEWLHFVTANRKGAKIINENDLSIGPVADDNVYQTIRYFETGVFDEEETIKRLKVEKLHDQWVVHTQETTCYLKFKNVIKVEE